MNKFVLRLPKGRQSGTSNQGLSTEKSSTRKRKSAAVLNTKSSRNVSSRTVQTYLDFGQRNLGKTLHCSKCGLMFTCDDADDQQHHVEFCRQINQPQLLLCLADYDVIRFLDDRKYSIISVSPLKSFPHKDSIRRCLSMIEEELGTDQDFICKAKSLLLCIDDSRRILGVVALEEVDPLQSLKLTGLEQVSTIVSQMSSISLSSEGCISKKSGKTSVDQELQRRGILMGVRLMWVHRCFRRKGVMKSLLDVARQTFIYGIYFDKRDVAFSQPTEEGFQFAKFYGSQEFVLCYVSASNI